MATMPLWLRRRSKNEPRLLGMKFGKALVLFLAGHFFGAIAATFIGHNQELGWEAGPQTVGFSLPTTAFTSLASGPLVFGNRAW